MSLRINTNVASITALNNLRSTDRSQPLTLERLSTGLRINRASDDPSGFVISEQLRAQVKSLDPAIENSQSVSNALRITDIAIDQVSNIRAYLGAFQKQTLESNISSLSVASENPSSSLSGIKDLDFAQETAAFTRAQIQFQAGTADPAQANQIPQAVLSLLR